MARVTIQDCLEKIPNRFKLLMIASKRAHQLAAGSANPQVDWDNDKPTVVALREIAAGFITKNSDLEDEETSHEQLSDSETINAVVDLEVARAEIETEAPTPTSQEDEKATSEEVETSSRQNMNPDA